MRRRLVPRSLIHVVVLIATAAATLSSCAYYNTYYLAKKYFDRGTGGLPYVLEKSENANSQDFAKTIEYSKKLIAQYPKDKWVDDAYLLWARSLLGTDDPRESIKLLEDFPAQFPKSPLKNDAIFYLGVAYRQTHKYDDALTSLDEFLQKAPRNKLAPYAHLERSRALMALDRPEEAAAAADQIIQHYSKSEMIGRARVARAEALYAQQAFDLARADFRELGARSRSDAERFELLLREADCIEGARRYDEELKLLSAAIAHEHSPSVGDTTPGMVMNLAANPGLENYGRLMLRIGTAHLLAGRFDQALESYRSVALSYRRTDLAAEAQYRIGYAYETSTDDFDKARLEYGRVKDHGGGSTYAAQANQRLTNLDRLAQYKSAGGDSVQKKSEAGFLLAELYLFQLDKPERALEQYRKIADEFEGTPIAAKAMNAQAWVLSRKLKQNDAADSLFWAVVHQYPATEAQIAARDYLEIEGVEVPAELIKMPERQLASADTLATPSEPQAEPPPAVSSPLLYSQPGSAVASGIDTTTRLGPRPMPMQNPALTASPPVPGSNPATGERGFEGYPGAVGAAAARRDSVGSVPARSDSSNSPPPAPVTPSTPAPVTPATPAPVTPAPSDSTRSPR
jgi:TolA-binding protein